MLNKLRCLYGLIRRLKKVDAVEYLRNFDSMCKSYESCCYRCPISRVNNCTKYYCRDYITQFPEKAVQIVEQWTEKQKKHKAERIFKNISKRKNIRWYYQYKSM